MKKIIAMIGSAMLLVALASVAFAHAEITSCIPVIDGTVETAPETLVCTSSQGMNPEGSFLKVIDASGVQVDKGDSKVDLDDPDRTKISVSLDTAKVTDGVYIVKWTTVSADDGDTASDEFKFTVGNAMDANATPEAAATPTPEPAATAAAAAEEGGTHADDHSMASATVDGKDVTLHIVAPGKGATLPAGDIKLEATVEGITLGENGAHLHFYADDKLAGMGEGAQTSFTLTLEPGAHELSVGLATSEHDDVLEAHVHVTVQAPAGSTTSARLPATGAQVNYSLFTMVALGGLVLFGTGALVYARARR